MDAVTFDLEAPPDAPAPSVSASGVRHLVLVVPPGAAAVPTLAHVPRGAAFACDTPAAAVVLRVALWASGVDADAFRYAPAGTPGAALAAGLVAPERSDAWVDVVPVADALDGAMVRAMLPYAAVVSTTSRAYSSHPRDVMFQTVQVPVVGGDGPADALGTADFAAATGRPLPQGRRRPGRGPEGFVAVAHAGPPPRCRVLESRWLGRVRRLECAGGLPPVRAGDVLVLRDGRDRGTYGVDAVGAGGAAVLSSSYALPPSARGAGGGDLVLVPVADASPGTAAYRLPMHDAADGSPAEFLHERGGTVAYRVRRAPRGPAPACVSDSDCAAYRGDLRLGGCRGDGTGCVAPVGAGTFRAMCHGCSGPPFCCDAQGASPDYVFAGDAPARLAAAASPARIDVRSLLPAAYGRIAAATPSASRSTSAP